MLNNFREYLKLIRDTRTFLQSQQAFEVPCPDRLRDSALSKNKESSHGCAIVTVSSQGQNLKDGVADLTLITSNSENENLKEISNFDTAISKPKEHSKTQIKEKKHTWELQPMPAIEAQSSFLKKLTPFTKTCHLHIPAVLVLPEEIVEHRFFLENVCRAITRTFVPATVTLYNEKVMKEGQGNFVFIPIALLNKKFPNAKPYEAFIIDPTYSNASPNNCQNGGITLMPIESIEKYLQDPSCKRVLWNAIQHLFRS